MLGIYKETIPVDVKTDEELKTYVNQARAQSDRINDTVEYTLTYNGKPYVITATPGEAIAMKMMENVLATGSPFISKEKAEEIQGQYESAKSTGLLILGGIALAAYMLFFRK